MALIKCAECGKEISDRAESCPNCGCPVGESVAEEVGNDYEESEYEEEEESEEYVEDEKQSGLGVASFILAIIVLAFALCQYQFASIGIISVALRLRIYRNILSIIAFILGTVGMFVKDRKHGFSVAGNVISFVFLWI